MKSSDKIFGTFGFVLTLAILAGCASSPDTASAGLSNLPTAGGG